MVSVAGSKSSAGVVVTTTASVSLAASHALLVQGAPLSGAPWTSVRNSAPPHLCIDAVFVTEMRPGRFTTCIWMVVRNDGERRGSTPHHPATLKIGPPDLESTALLLLDTPIDRPARTRHVVEVSVSHDCLPTSNLPVSR